MPPEREVAQTENAKGLQLSVRPLQVGGMYARFVNAHAHKLRKRKPSGCAVFFRPVNERGLFAVAGSAACGTGDVHIRQKLHIQADRACAVAHGAAQRSGVVREIARFESHRPSFFGVGESAPEFIVRPRIGCNGRSHVDSDRRSVDEVCARDPVGVDALYMRGRVRRRCY